MPVTCVAFGCSNIASEEVSLYFFPKDDKLRQEWTKQVQRTRDRWAPSKYSVLCSDHFTADCFEDTPGLQKSFGLKVRYKKVLKPGSIPTIFKRKSTEESAKATTSKQRREATVGKLARKTEIAEIMSRMPESTITTSDATCHRRLRKKQDVQQLAIKEEAADKLRPDVNQQDPEPLLMVVVVDDVSTSVEETDVTRFTSEDDDLPISSSADQMKQEVEDEDYEEIEITWNPDLHHKDDSDLSQNEVSEDDDLPIISSADQMKQEVDDKNYEEIEITWNPALHLNEDDPDVSLDEVTVDDEDENNPGSQLSPSSDSGLTTKNRSLIKKKHFRAKLNLDRTKQTTPKPFTCDDCGKIFSSKTDLSRHLRVHTREKPFTCDFCRKGFSQKSTLVMHTRIHTDPHSFSCDVCGRTFNFKSSLISHMRIHTDPLCFSCDVCGRTFKCKRSLYRHMRIHTDPLSFSCDVCRQTFNFKSGLISHMRIHTDPLSFSCDVCGRTFNCKSNFNRHMKTHTKQKDYGCDVYRRMISGKGKLKKRMRIHTKQKQFECDECGQIFKAKQHLITHMRRVHTEPNSFCCDVCGRTFNFKCHLYRHVMVHTEQKQFVMHVEEDLS